MLSPAEKSGFKVLVFLRAWSLLLLFLMALGSRLEAVARTPVRHSHSQIGINERRYVDRGQVHRAHTPRGTFKVLRKINGWRLSSLGLLYYPSYILNGIAVHGSLSVPTYPASHGCIRVPMFAAKELSGLMPIGIEVNVYGG